MAQNTGISINLISIERLAQMGSRDKIRFILNEVRRGKVLVLERGLTANEEAELIKTTMANIDHRTFIGIEMQSYSREDVTKGSWLSKLLGRKQPPRMSVIGPADLLKTVHKDGNMIQAMILTKESIVGEGKGQKKTLPAPPQGKKMPSEVSNRATPNAGAEPQSLNTTSSDSKNEEAHPKEEKSSEGN